jgi:alpha-aminoadipic semialdehyde synthase
MEMLDTILAKKIRLIDYEKIVDEKGNRLIAFGVFAGLAGAIDFLAGFGHYLLLAGYSTPLLNISYSYKYFDLEDAYASIKKVSERLVHKGIDQSLRPVIFAVTGRGKTATGAIKVLNYLPVKHVSPDELPGLVADKDNPAHATTIYLTNINTEDVIISRDPADKFDKTAFYKTPEKFKNVFNKKYLPYISCLFHCIYWDSKSPRYIKNKHLKKLA